MRNQSPTQSAGSMVAIAAIERSDLPPTLREAEDDPMPLVPDDAVAPLRERVEKDEDFLIAVRDGYAKDSLFSKVVAKPDEHTPFTMCYIPNHPAVSILTYSSFEYKSDDGVSRFFTRG